MTAQSNTGTAASGSSTGGTTSAGPSGTQGSASAGNAGATSLGQSGTTRGERFADVHADPIRASREAGWDPTTNAGPSGHTRAQFEEEDNAPGAVNTLAGPTKRRERAAAEEQERRMAEARDKAAKSASTKSGK